MDKNPALMGSEDSVKYWDLKLVDRCGLLWHFHTPTLFSRHILSAKSLS